MGNTSQDGTIPKVCPQTRAFLRGGFFSSPLGCREYYIEQGYEGVCHKPHNSYSNNHIANYIKLTNFVSKDKINISKGEFIMAQSIRDQIRAATLGAKPQFKSKIVEWQGTEIEVKQPNLKDRKQLLNRARDDKGQMDMLEFIVWSVILNSYTPGTNEKVFSPEDYEAMMEMNTGGFIDALSSAVSELMNNDEVDQKKS